MKTEIKAVLASVIIIALCLTAVGEITYSWFSDSDQTEITVSKATVEVEVTDLTISGDADTTVSVTDDNIQIQNLAADRNLNGTYSITNTSSIKVIYRTYVSIVSGNTAPDSDHIYIGTSENDKIPLSGAKHIGVGNGIILTNWTVIEPGNDIIADQEIYIGSDSGLTLSTGDPLILRLVVEAYQSDYKIPIEDGYTVITEDTPNVSGEISIDGNNEEKIEAEISFDSVAAGIADGQTLSIIASKTTSGDGFTISNQNGNSLIALNLSLNNTESTDFNDGVVTITVTVPMETDPAQNVNIVYNGSGDQPTFISQTYSSGDKTLTVTFTTTHFSEFVIIPTNDVTVSTTSALIGSLAVGMNVTLGNEQPISTDNSIVIPDGTESTLNLNGKTVKYTGDDKAIINYGNLTISDVENDLGNIVTTSTNGRGHHVLMNYGTITINGGTFGDSTTVGNAIRNLGTATIYGGTFTACDNYVTLGNGKAEGYAYAIANGDENHNNAQMTISNVTVSGSMNGAVGCDGGTITIEGGQFTLSGERSFHMLYVSGSANIIVKNGLFARATNNQNAFYNIDGTEGHITIYGGIFSDVYNPTAAEPRQFLSSGFASIYSTTIVNEINVRYYSIVGSEKIDLNNITTSEDFYAALQLVQTGGNITLGADITIKEIGNYGNGTPNLYCRVDGITLDLNDHTITVETNNKFMFTGDNITLKNGTVRSPEENPISYVCAITAGATGAKFIDVTFLGGIEVLGSGASLTLENVDITSTNYHCVYLAGGSSIEVYGGSLTPSENNFCFYVDGTNNTATIHSGITKGPLKIGNGEVIDMRT